MVGRVLEKKCFREAKRIGEMVAFGRFLLQFFIPHVHKNIPFYGFVWVLIS